MEPKTVDKELGGALKPAHEDVIPPSAISSHLLNLVKEVKKYYGRHVRPPFVITTNSRTLHTPGDTRSLVLAADDGKYPQAPVKHIELTYRLWDDGCLFTTVELDGFSRIVKSISGGTTGSIPGGSVFRLWQGPDEGFSKIPIAYPDKGPMSSVIGMKKVAPSHQITVPSTDPSRKRIVRASRSLRASDSGVIYNWTDPHDNDFPPRVVGQRASIRRRPKTVVTSDSSSSSSSDGDGDDVIIPLLNAESSKFPALKAEPREPVELLTPGSSVPRALSNAKRNITYSTGATSTQSRAGQLQHSDETDKILIQMRHAGKTWQAIADHFNAMSGHSSSGAKWCARYDRTNRKRGATTARDEAARSQSWTPVKKKRPRKGQPEDSNDETDPDDETDDYDVERNPAKRNFHLAPHARRGGAVIKAQRYSEGDTTVAAKRSSGQMNGNKPPPLRLRPVNSQYPTASPFYFGNSGEATPSPLTAVTAPLIPPPLAPEKLNRTILHIVHSGSYTPIKLRSCPTMPSLFAAVLKISGMGSHPENVEALKATFTWMPELASDRNILLKEGFEDSFEFLCETIDEAPCWRNKNGKCTIRLEVVHRTVAGEPLENAWVGTGRWPASDIS
jgi:hypothetical protein